MRQLVAKYRLTEAGQITQRRADQRRLTKAHIRKAFVIHLHGGKCVDCGVAYPPFVYDFHHFIKPRSFGINTYELQRRHIQEVIQEARKCVLLCANCHRQRHFTTE